MISIGKRMVFSSIENRVNRTLCKNIDFILRFATRQYKSNHPFYRRDLSLASGLYVGGVQSSRSMLCTSIYLVLEKMLGKWM